MAITSDSPGPLQTLATPIENKNSINHPPNRNAYDATFIASAHALPVPE